MNKTLISALSLLIAVGFISALVSFSIARSHRPPDLSETHNFDMWLHKQLSLSEQQLTSMAEEEELYHQRQRQYISEIENLNKELSQAVLEDRRASLRVQEIVQKIHSAQGKLQNASIMHVFEMERHLSREQYDKLLIITAEVLNPAGSSVSPAPSNSP
jgi:hypothetical protein